MVFEGRSNNSLVTATPLPLREDPAGSGLWLSEQGLGSIEPADDVDYWSFEALAGDVVSVSVDTPDSDLNPYVELRNAGDGGLVGDHDAGPWSDAFISHYVIDSSGTYYVLVCRGYWWDTTPGSYQVHVELARGIQQESDGGYSNDSTGGANTLSLALGSPGHRVATVSGMVMEPEWGNTDEDLYGWGTINAGNVVELNVRLPSTSTLVPKVSLVDSAGVAVTDEDGDPNDGHFLGTIAVTGMYYGKIESPMPRVSWFYGGHWYVALDWGMGWNDAEAYAQGMGGHLVTINDAAENEWLRSTFVGSGQTWWIGLTDQVVEGTWEWSSGEAVGYTNWATGQPDSWDDWYGGEADGGVLQGDGTWADYHVGRGFGSLAELEVNRGSPGPRAQYLLDVDVVDLVPPQVMAVSPVPAPGGSTDKVVDRLTVTVSEDLEASTVNAVNPLIGQYNGHYYLLTPTAMTWGDAEAYAQGLGGHLVTINDAAEQAYVQQWFWASSPWIGLTDQMVEGTWEWSSAEAVGYTNWAPGQPNNWDEWWGGEADSVFMQADGMWVDFRGDHPFWGLVELESVIDSDGDGVPDVVDVYPSDALNAWDLREAGLDGVFDTSDDVVYRLVLDPTYTSGLSIGLLIEDGPLGNGHYRFTANSTITDRSVNALDGNGDGVGGDAYQHIFDVSLPLGMVFEGRSNNSLVTATPLPLREDPAGSGLWLSEQGLGSIEPADDVDYWSFEALAGDVVSVSVDTPDSDLNPYVELRNAGDGGLVGDHDAGPWSDAFISHYVIDSSGTYYVLVCRGYWWDTTPGSYQVHVELARGIQQESDGGYSNDSTGGANTLSLALGSPGHRVATVSGMVMEPEWGNTDEDLYGWGTINAGNVVELNVRLPSTSTLVPKVSLVDSAGVAVTDEDGDPNDGHFLGTIAVTGMYYGKIESPMPRVSWFYGGHWYVALDWGMGWNDAEAYAQGMGGHLVTINDAAENEWLRSTFVGSGQTWWIGLTDQVVEGTWEWSSGEAVGYTNWATGQPDSWDDWYGGEADGGVLQGDGTWADYHVGRGFGSLAELEVNRGSPGPRAQYLLDVDVVDLVPPQVMAVSPVPAPGGSTDKVVDRLTVTVSEDLEASTVNAVNPLIGQYNGHYYLLTPTAMTWGDAEAYAQGLGGHLVTINDAAEQAYVQQWFWASSPWIGLTDQMVEGTWEWSSAEAVGYTNWAPGQPNNWDEWWGGEADSVFMQADGMWVDFRGDHPFWGLVELESVIDSDGDGVPDVVDVYPSDALNAWDLREAGLDGVFDTSDDVVYRLVLDPTYTSGLSIGLLIEDGPLGNGHYRFTANSTITDRSVNALDGNGDGVGGDAYQHIFDVSLPLGMVFEGRSNNSLVTATPLPLREDPAGSGLWLSEQGLGSIEPADDVDYWSFEALAGDVVSVSVSRYQTSGLSPYVELRNAADGGLVGSYSGGGNGALISHYEIPSSGTYYLLVSRVWWSGSTGAYQVHVELVRRIQQESDANYSNDSTSGANTIQLQVAGARRSGAIAGTLMAPESGNVDEDYFNLGVVNAGETILISLRLPQSSSLDRPVVEIRDSHGNPLVVVVSPIQTAARVHIAQRDTYYVSVVAISEQGPRGQYLMDAAVWPTSTLDFPDLIISEVTAPATALSGQVMRVSWRVENAGTGTTYVGSWYDRVALSANGRYGDSDDIELQTS